MTDLFECLVEKKQEISAFPIGEYWLDIGHTEDFEKANGEFIENFRWYIMLFFDLDFSKGTLKYLIQFPFKMTSLL